MKIQFVDLKRQNQLHHSEWMKAIETAVDSAEFIMGETLENFEKFFAEFCQVKYCLGLNSGTDALELALRALEIGPGDEVITAPNSYFSSAMVISKVGATPIFADIDPDTYTIDPQKVSSAISSRTKAIMPVHLYGQAADMDPLIKLAKKHHLHIIEDCCQAHGAKYKGKTVPVTGLGAFSFYPGKNLGSFGDGGALVTNSARIAQKVKMLRNDGTKQKYHHYMIGYKSRLDTLQAAILAPKLKHLNAWNQLRLHHAHTYYQRLKKIPYIKLPHIGPQHVCHVYVIEALHRDKLQEYLFMRGISTVIHYPIPIHLQPPYKKLGYRKGDFPVTEAATKKIISLPMFPELTITEIDYIAKTIESFYSSYSDRYHPRSRSKPLSKSTLGR